MANINGGQTKMMSIALEENSSPLGKNQAEQSQMISAEKQTAQTP